MRPIQTFKISPLLPEQLNPLKELAYNLWWTWDHEARDLFRRLDTQIWDEYVNPVRSISLISHERLEELAEDDGFLAHMDRVYEKFTHYIKERTWYAKKYNDGKYTIAYFSMEFGLAKCIPNYSGGLGVLSGDHLKSASDLGIPLVGVGLLYQKGYFRQYLNVDGWQQELNPINDFHNMPITLIRGKDKHPVTIEVEYPERIVKAQVWRISIGRVPLYLLDTNIPENDPKDQDITDELYGGDNEMRIQQEIMLGIGGFRALKKLGIPPMVCHMNEGHSAFLALERIRTLMVEHGLNYYEAREAATTGNVFTTHTPVPAGIDKFPEEIIDKHLGHYYQGFNISRDEFLLLGKKNPDSKGKLFSMALLAIHLSHFINGVSQLHGEVSRQIWKEAWKQVPEDENPITSITNGIHAKTWVSRDMAALYERYMGPRWTWEPADHSIWEAIERIPAGELWRSHERHRERLVAFARRRQKEQLENRGASRAEIRDADEILNPDALTIGFARRFATYKRATLLFHNSEHLAQILLNKERPVQIIFAGKAHPKDQSGKELIRKIIHLCREPEFRHNIVFIEDYDYGVAHYLVQGVDVWLNTPRRPLEASGTSGMKAAVNGVINMSILDGWWAEAYNIDAGWAIGQGEEYGDIDYQDEVESAAIYDLLEKEVIPLFYQRNSEGLPVDWVNRMKLTMRTVCPDFNTNRMVTEYTERAYLPAAKHYQALMRNKESRLRKLAEWKDHLKRHWSEIRIDNVKTNGWTEVNIGDKMRIRATIYLGTLKPEDIAVEIYHGPIDSNNNISKTKSVVMSLSKSSKENNNEDTYTYQGILSCNMSGLHGYTIRVIPNNKDLLNPMEMGLIIWSTP